MKHEKCIMRANEAKNPVYVALKDVSLRSPGGSVLNPYTVIETEFYYVVASSRARNACQYIWPSLKSFVLYCKRTFGNLTENSGDTLYT